MHLSLLLLFSLIRYILLHRLFGCSSCFICFSLSFFFFSGFLLDFRWLFFFLSLNSMCCSTLSSLWTDRVQNSITNAFIHKMDWMWRLLFVNSVVFMVKWIGEWGNSNDIKILKTSTAKNWQNRPKNIHIGKWHSGCSCVPSTFSLMKKKTNKKTECCSQRDTSSILYGWFNATNQCNPHRIAPFRR